MWKLADISLADFKKKVENTWSVLSVPNPIPNTLVPSYFYKIESVRREEHYYLCNFWMNDDGMVKVTPLSKNIDKTIFLDEEIKAKGSIVYYAPDPGYFNSFDENGSFIGCFSFNKLSDVQWKIGLTSKVASIHSTSSQIFSDFIKKYNYTKNHNTVAKFEVFVPTTSLKFSQNQNIILPKEWGKHLPHAFDRDTFDLVTSESFIRKTIFSIALSKKLMLVNNFYGSGYMICLYPNNTPIYTFKEIITETTINKIFHRLVDGKILTDNKTHIIKDFIDRQNRNDYGLQLIASGVN